MQPVDIRGVLAIHPDDAGCAGTWQLVDAYAEAIVRGERPERRFPGVAVHHRVCPACRTDFEGLLETLIHTKGDRSWV